MTNAQVDKLLDEMEKLRQDVMMKEAVLRIYLSVAKTLAEDHGVSDDKVFEMINEAAGKLAPVLKEELQ